MKIDEQVTALVADHTQRLIATLLAAGLRRDAVLQGVARALDRESGIPAARMDKH